ncbi:uncharacterized protein LOC117897335 isoform X2 [Drosophila subobscura]|uniref:uncharacterized protein LOC117897335 isoform X2 n=1 Tax=Drosophila subobscura TaxID=7241 RepID=UPI00155B3454|nr:uncharacterized protein LOC117897335 isoform X2 [Drosophila subobscura]
MANGADLMELPGEESKNMEVKSDGPEISPDAQAKRLEAERLMIEAEISLLQRKQALEELRKGSVNELANFKKVMQIMEPYAGKVNSAHAWMEEFELNCKGTDAFKLRCVRRLMKAETDAELFLKVNKATSYAAFKKGFLDTFGRISSIVEVINTLKSTVYCPGKMSVLGYVLQMQEIAQRAPIDEEQAVQFVIDGLKDDSADIAIFYPAKTIGELVKLSHRYEEMRKKRWSASQSAKKLMGHNSIPASSGITVLCYNCLGTGHIAQSCTQPKRMKGSCFRCGSMDHAIKNCKVPPPSGNKAVPLSDQFRQEGTSKEVDDNEVAVINTRN